MHLNENIILQKLKEGDYFAFEHLFKTYVVEDAIAAVQPDSENEKAAFAEMKDAGIILVQSVHIQ